MIRWLLDLAAVAFLALLAGAALFSFNGPLRIALVFPLIIFVPGYAFLSALFPEEGSLSRSRRSRKPWGTSDYPDRQTNQDDSFLLGNIERIGLSVVLSLALVPFVVFGLNFTVGFDARRIGIMLLGFTGAMIVFAIARRVVLPPEERYTLEFSTFQMDTTSMVMLAGSLLVLAASVGTFAIMSPTSEPWSGYSIVAKNESTGEMTFNETGAAIIDGRPVTIIIQNDKEMVQDYTVVVARQAVNDGEVTSSKVVKRFTPTVTDGESKHIKYQPPSKGDQLIFYFYNGSAPENPSPGSADEFLRYSLSSSSEEGEAN